MTEDRKPETPGLAEVSAKFVDETKAATAAPLWRTERPDDPLIALGHQWKEVYGKWTETKGYPDTFDREEIDKYETERKMLLCAVDQLEDQVAEVSAQSIAGVLVQLRMAGTHYHLMERDGEKWANTYAHLTWQAWDGLERLVVEGAPAVPVSVTEPEDAVVALRQRWENVMVERGQLKNRDDTDPKHPDVIEDARLHDVQLGIEESIANTPTYTAAGVVAKLRQLQRNETQFDGDAPWRPAAFMTALEALGRNTMPAIEDPVLVLKREFDARWERYKSETDDSDEVLDPLHERMNEVAYQIFQTPATTLAGIAVKLVLWARQHIGHDATGKGWSGTPVTAYPRDLDHLPVVSALHDLERLVRTTMVAETPPAKDAALFDALAEYDRLVAISQGLERRQEVFRPDTPENKEATKAFEAAHDKAMAAWAAARDIPSTTRAGLFAKLQATIRFMTDLEQDELYEAEWQAIKADVQRVAG